LIFCRLLPFFIDGKQDAAWSSSNTTDNEDPDLRLKVMFNSSFLFVLVEVRVANHDDDEYVKLLLSNVTDADPEDFTDAKLIQTRNFSNSVTRSYFIQDQHYDSGDYIEDSQTNFEGAANVTTGANTYSYYEFKLPSKTVNFDYTNDTSIDFDKTIELTLEFGSHEEGGTPTVQTTGVVVISFEKGEGDTGEIQEYPINLKILAYVIFSVVAAGFIVIIVITYQSRSKI